MYFQECVPPSFCVTVGQIIWLHRSHRTLKSQVPAEHCSFVQGSPEGPSWWRFDKMWTLVAEMKCEIEEPSTEAARRPDGIEQFSSTSY